MLISLGLSNPDSISIANLPKENTFLIERVREDYALFKKERQESILTSVLRYDYTNMDSLLNSVEDRIRRLGDGWKAYIPEETRTLLDRFHSKDSID